MNVLEWLFLTMAPCDAAELTTLFLSRITNFYTNLKVDEIVSVGDGIVFLLIVPLLFLSNHMNRKGRSPFNPGPGQTSSSANQNGGQDDENDRDKARQDVLYRGALNSLASEMQVAAERDLGLKLHHNSIRSAIKSLNPGMKYQDMLTLMVRVQAEGAQNPFFQTAIQFIRERQRGGGTRLRTG